MKRKFYSTFLIFSGVACTVLFTNATTDKDPGNNKFLVLKPHKHDRSPANFNKARAPLSTSVVRTDDGSDKSLIYLQGSVKSYREFKNLKVTWVLPADVEVVSGAIETNINLNPGESQSYEILVKSKTAQNRQIYFNVESTDLPAGDNYGSSAQYNTTRQELIAKQLKENLLKAREQVRAGQLRKIIF